MKILHIISTFPPAYAFGGPPQASFLVCKELAKRGHYVEVYTTNAYDQKRNFKQSNKQVIIHNIKVTYFSNFIRINNLYIAPEMVIKLWKTAKQFDIVHVHFGRQLHDAFFGLGKNDFYPPYVLQARGALPYIGRMRSIKLIYDRLFGERVLKNASKVIALTRFEAEQYKYMGVPENKIVIIPNGIDLTSFSNMPPKGSFKEKYGIPEGKKIILYIGRIHWIKGVDILVKAYAQLVRQQIFRDAILVVVGSDDGYLSKVRSLVQELGISDLVVFTGPLYGRDKLCAYVDAEFVVLPSRYETFPNVLLEAYACAKPVIASNVEAMPDLVLHGETGLLFRAGDENDLAGKLAYLLENPKEAEKMGRNARRLAEEKYSIDKVAAELEKVYEEVIH